MASYLTRQSSPDPRDWKAVPGYTDKFGKPLKFARIGGKPGNTGHYLYITANHNPGDIEEIASNNKKLADEESLKRATERRKNQQIAEDKARKREHAAIRERHEKEMAKQGFGKEGYFIAKQLWLAENAPYGTKYLLYKNDLARNNPRFNELDEQEQKRRVKAHIKADKDDEVPRSYYDQLGRAMRPLGLPDLKEHDHHEAEKRGGYGHIPLQNQRRYLNVYQERDAADNLIPMQNPAPVLEDKFHGQMGLPHNFGSYDQRWEAYQEFKEQQRLEQIEKQRRADERGREYSAFSQYMGSINPLV